MANNAIYLNKLKKKLLDILIDIIKFNRGRVKWNFVLNVER